MYVDNDMQSEEGKQEGLKNHARRTEKVRRIKKSFTLVDWAPGEKDRMIILEKCGGMGTYLNKERKG